MGRDRHRRRGRPGRGRRLRHARAREPLRGRGRRRARGRAAGGGGAMIYRRRASPLHAARAAAGGAYCLALAVCALSFEHPLILGATVVAAVGAAVGAGAVGELLTAARFTIPLGLLVALVNPFVIHEGLTVIWRFGGIPPFGQIDITLEALVFRLLLRARAAAGPL